MKSGCRLTAGIVMVLFLFGTAYAEPTIWYVHPDSTQNCIQDCLDACASNDIVLVGPGTYVENIVWPSAQGIHLISELGPDVTIIDGDNTDCVIRLRGAFDTTTVIKGFTIYNGYHHDAGGIYCYDHSSPTITDNIITNNASTFNSGGIECYGNSSPIIAYNTITNNTTPYSGGIECVYTSSPTIVGNTITGNTVTINAGGIGCYYSSSPTITGNTISGNNATAGGGIFCWHSSPTIADNIISNNTASGGGGIALIDTCSAIIIGNTITGNTTDTLGGGIGIRTSSPTITNNIITDNVCGLRGGGIYCDSSSAGTIDSNTISNNISSRYGGGIYCMESSSPDIRYNTVTGNEADTGAGIHCAFNSSPHIFGNTITENAAVSCGGILCTYGSHAMIEDNYIANNTVDFTCGGIACVQSDPYITRNTITGNESGLWMAGIGAGNASAPIIHDNDITNNHAIYSAGVGLEHNGTITNNRITGNIADSAGGGITFETSSSPTNIKHNIVSNNTAPRGAGIWCNEYSSPVIDTCTITGNIGDGVTCESFSGPHINYCNIYDNTAYGIRNTDMAVLVDAENNWWGDATGPYHPSANPGGLGDSVTDYIDFDPWLADSVEGVGVEEFKPEEEAITYLRVYPNPFSKLININFEVDSRQYAVGSVKIYDITGRSVRTLLNQSPMPKAQSLTWDGTDDANRQLPSGVFFLEFEAGDYRATEKLLFVR